MGIRNGTRRKIRAFKWECDAGAPKIVRKDHSAVQQMSVSVNGEGTTS